MIVGIHHNITDSKKWEETTNQIRADDRAGQVAEGREAAVVLRRADGRAPSGIVCGKRIRWRT